jgi:subtilisin
MKGLGKGLALAFCGLFMGVSAQLWAGDHTAVIVGFRGPTDEGAIFQKRGMVHRKLKLSNALSADLPLNEIAALRRDPRVKYVEPDAEANIQAAERPAKISKKYKASPQPAQFLPWGVNKIDAELVVLPGDPANHQVPVAIIDTGIYYSHPDLVGNANAGPSFVYGTPTSLDDEGHGTHVAGTVAAVKNTIGVVGVAPKAKVWGVKVLDRYGSGYYSAIASGLDWAADHGMKVANMSLGGSYNSMALQAACAAANADGVLLVAAAGNDGKKGKPSYPGAYPSVVCVSATTSQDKLATFSSRGPHVDLSAPGEGISSTVMPASYQSWSGTSMATPHVSGAAALVWGANPSFTNNDVRLRLQSTAVDLGTPGLDPQFGWGRVNAYRAVNP